MEVSIKKSIVTMGLSLSLFVTMGAAVEKEVVLENGFTNKTYTTQAETVGAFLDENQIELKEGYVAFPSEDTNMKDVSEVKIKKGYEITIKDRGEKKQYSVSSLKVGKILEELNIELGGLDSLSQDVNSDLDEEHILVIHRVEDKETTEETVLEFQTEVRQNPDLYQGESRVIQEGKNGSRMDTILSRSVDGEVVQSFVVASQILSEPVNKIVEEGTKVPENMIHGKKYVKKIVMQGTAYDPSAGSRTAMGTRARVGAVAVDPRVIPLGTKLYIESADGFPTYGFAVAEDTGGAIKGNKIDLFYNTRSEAYRFGRRNVVVYILDENQ
ncbi:3D domain-containing protein [Peptoniphilus sp. KCTC 25270]|uniref:3D domain-containing protein n=1 Tax=Peptoniphilus sp. KCTC 25270 TaxID=2897414 RepID=UPI00272A200B|nr:3D domain-containing protein [Peptoniphilus sp. KCTC 25270]